MLTDSHDLGIGRDACGSSADCHRRGRGGHEGQAFENSRTFPFACAFSPWPARPIAAPMRRLRLAARQR